jgi:hypothetical protein
MMPSQRLICLCALWIAACAPCLAADLPAPHAKGPVAAVRPPSGGLAWGLTPGVGQLGATGLGYYHTEDCWSRQPQYDAFDNYLGEQPTNICVELHAN